MATTDLVFRLLGLNEASAAFREVKADAQETAGATDEANESSGLFGMGAGTAFLAVAAGAAMVAVKCVDMAAKFQAGMESLVTGAGESQSNIKMVSDGILNMAVATGTSTEQLTSGMYMIESAGFHGAQGLLVLKAAAEGAKVGNADLGDVANALTDVLNDYHLPASKAVDVTDQLVAAVAAGKMHMSDLASSLSNVVPLASSAHISFAQVAGAISTMTLHGMSAQQATQDLANTIRSLQAPNAVAVNEMQQLGLNSNQVSMQLGQKGLTGTLSELTEAITSHMGPAGTVLQSTFASSTTAAADAKQMIGQMPAALQKLAEQYLTGSVSAKSWRTDLQALDPVQAHLMTQFAGTADKAHSFNSLLTAGGPAAQTYNAALEKMTGGATGLNTSLMLSGENSVTFAENVKAIGAAGQSTSRDVTGWSTVTSTLSFKLDQAREVMETLGIRIGTALLPVAKALVSGFIDIASHAGVLMAVFGSVIHIVGDVVTWLDKNRAVAEALGIGLAAVGVVMLASAIPAIIATTVAWGAQAVAAGAAAVATLAAAAPFIAIGVAVAAVAYGIIELIRHWNDVTAAFGVGVDFIKAHWKELIAVLLPGVGLIIDAIVELVENWHEVQAALTDAWRATVNFAMNDFVLPVVRFFTETIPSAWRSSMNFFYAVFVAPIKSAISDVEHAFSDAFNAIPKLVSTAFSGLVGIVKMPIDGVIDIVDAAIGALDSIHVSIPSWVPLVGGESFGISIPKIPQLAAGGLVLPQPGGTQVDVAEAGQPEIVSPIPAMEQAMTVALQNSGMGMGNPANMPGTAGNPLHAELDLLLNGQQLNRVLVVWQQQGGVFTAARTAVNG